MKKSFILPALLLLASALFSSCSLTSSYKPTGYALVYGVTQYNLVPDLTATRPDAQGMADLFESEGYTVLLRIDDDNGVPASRDQLTEDIAWVSQRISPSDNFVFYFSGHGGRHYDVYGTYSDPSGTETAGSDPDDEWIFLYGSLYSLSFSDFSKTAISDDQLGDMVADIPTSKKLIVIDACNSGGFIGNSVDVDGIPPNYIDGTNTSTPDRLSKALELYLKYPDVPQGDIPWNRAIVLSAAGEQEYSVEDDTLGHGIFTWYFLNSPSGADGNGDGVITVDEIYGYVSDRITEKWDKAVSGIYNFHPHVSGGPTTFALLRSR